MSEVISTPVTDCYNVLPKYPYRLTRRKFDDERFSIKIMSELLDSLHEGTQLLSVLTSNEVLSEHFGLSNE